MYLSEHADTSVQGTDSARPLDCLIIGGGAGGLTAALYLARFRRHALVVDEGKSRLCLIPTSHNYPGFPAGVHGKELHGRLVQQARHYGASLTIGSVTQVSQVEVGIFKVSFADTAVFAKTILLATGATDIPPEIAGFQDALRSTALRYCPICDGFEAIGKKVGVLGSGAHGVRESLFIRHYATDLTLISPTTLCATTSMQSDELASHGVKVIDAGVERIACRDDRISVQLADGSVEMFDVLYSALGLNPNSSLAAGLGADLDADGQVNVDEHMQSTMKGVYAVGDVAHGLNQISVATGQAAIAATAIHNALRATARSIKN